MSKLCLLKHHSGHSNLFSCINPYAQDLWPIYSIKKFSFVAHPERKTVRVKWSVTLRKLPLLSIPPCAFPYICNVLSPVFSSLLLFMNLLHLMRPKSNSVNIWVDHHRFVRIAANSVRPDVISIYLIDDQSRFGVFECMLWPCVKSLV